MKTALPLVVLLTLAGCASPAPPAHKPAPAAPKPPDKRVIVDSAAKGMLRVVDVNTATGLDGILKVQVDVQNLLPTAKTFLYQVDWLDKDGVSLGLTMEPLRWTLLRQEFASLTVTAPVPVAKDFRILFRVHEN